MGTHGLITMKRGSKSFCFQLAKGKSKKPALIAVCNKLLKQAFAIAKSGIPYDPNYVSVIPSV